MNYGETLAYWYLRLNGFFPLKNFVLHSSKRIEDDNPSNRFNDLDPDKKYIHAADCDLIAIRFPFVYEEVGGQSPLSPSSLEGRIIEGIENSDWDSRFRDWRIPLDKDIIGLVVEVKTQDLSVSDARNAINQSFVVDRLLMDVQRMGILPLDEAKEAADKLVSCPLFSHQQSNAFRICIGKLLVSGTSRNLGPFVHNTLHITLDEISEFIRERMRKYSGPKYRDRMFFSDDLLQYLAWEANKNN